MLNSKQQKKKLSKDIYNFNHNHNNQNNNKNKNTRCKY